MVGFAFIFLAVILLMPIVFIVVFDFVVIRLFPPFHLGGGFEVLPPAPPPVDER
jgi:hypothetical protein